MEASRRTAVYAGLVVVIIFLAGAFLLSFVTEWQKTSQGFMLRIKFSYLNNLDEGAPVLLSGGLSVGTVEKIYQDKLQTYVRVYLSNMLRDRIPKKQGTHFAIFSTSLVGQKYINLRIPEAEPGDEYLQDGDEWWGINPPSVDQMLLAFSSWFGGQSGGEVFDTIFGRAKRLMAGINALIKENQDDASAAIADARKSYARYSKQLDNLTKQHKAMVKDIVNFRSERERGLADILDDLNQSSQNLNRLTKRFDSGPGSYARLRNSRELRANLRLTRLYARQFVECFKTRPYVFVSKESCI